MEDFKKVNINYILPRFPKIEEDIRSRGIETISRQNSYNIRLRDNYWKNAPRRSNVYMEVHYIGESLTISYNPHRLTADPKDIDDINSITLPTEVKILRL